MTSAWDHYDKAERPKEAAVEKERDLAAAEPIHPRHVSVEAGDILHVGDEAYLVTGTIALGMPVREITLHLSPADG